MSAKITLQNTVFTSILLRYITLTTLIAGVCLLGYLTSNSDSSVIPNSVKLSSYLTEYINSNESTTSSTETAIFPGITLARKGYNPLEYFTSNASDFMTYEILLPHIAIVEPSADMVIYVEDNDAAKMYKVEVCDNGNHCTQGKLYTTEERVVSDTIAVPCLPGSILTISFTSVYHNSFTKRDEFNVSNGTALCMYVRREIRSLTADDLDATMDAMHTIWATSESQGQEKYGAKFHSIDYFLELHHFNAAQQEADHFHEVENITAYL